MADKNKCWFSIDVGNYTLGKKASAFAGGDTMSEAVGNLAELLGGGMADALIAHFVDAVGDPFAVAEKNLNAGGVATSSDPNAPLCKHGARKLVEGRSKNGPWKAWMCPTDKGAVDKCDPQWV